MASTKIHCGYYEVFGPNWLSITNERAKNIISVLERIELQGEEPFLFGFVGTGKTNYAVSGFLAIQYPTALRHYDKQKRLDLRNDQPFERVFFILFAKTGKLILQHKKFIDVPISMERVLELIQKALAEVLSRANIGFVFSINIPDKEIVRKEIFIEEFKNSDRVERLSISSPKANEIPTDINYYNPNYEKNPIIRESHQHDYPNFKVVDLEASENGDLKNTHLAKDLIRAGTPTLMRYSTNNETITLKNKIPSKFELYVDVDAESISSDVLKTIIEMLEKELGLPVNIPVQTDSKGQMTSLLGYPENEEDENNE